MITTTIVIPGPRYEDAIKMDEAVYKIAARAQRAWAWLMFAALVDFMTLLLIPRHDFAIIAPVVIWWASSLVVLVVAAYITRAIIERRQLPAVVAEAVAFYKLPLRDMHSGVLSRWIDLLREANATNWPADLKVWLDGPHATWLCVLGSALNAYDHNGSGEGILNRALAKLKVAAESYAVDTRRVARYKSLLAAAEGDLNRHLLGS